MSIINIMIVGVGGQGTLLTSRVLGSVGMKKSYDVKVSEVHGMAQRGGSVVTYVRMGENVCSPLIEKGEADIIVAFEQLEAIRFIDYLKTDGKILINDQKINPMPVIMGKVKYPESIIEKIGSICHNEIRIDALNIAKECGNIKAVNMVLLGLLAKFTDIEKEVWIDAMKENVPQKFLEINIKAFERGYTSTTI